MKFGKVGVLGLCLLGIAVLALALFAPSLFFGNGKTPINQAGQTLERQWPLSAKGAVESTEEVQLASKLEGQITELLVDEGDAVQTGQMLIRFDRSKIDARIAADEAALRYAAAKRREAETGYRREDTLAARHAVERTAAISDEARRNYERQQRLFSQGAVTSVARDRAEEGWQVAQANHNEAKSHLEKMLKGPRSEELAAARADEERARAQLEFARALANDYDITSPIDGVVINRFRNRAETVEIGTPILTLVNPATLRVWAELEESDVGRVAMQQNVVVIVDAFPGKEFKGKVTKVFAAVQRKSQRSFDPVATFDINTQKILITLDEYQGLVHGMSVTARFIQ